MIHVQHPYDDPRIAATYDPENTGRADIEHYLAVADLVGASDVVDLGCGTGILAVELAARGHRVTGVDPATAMLSIARGRPGGDRVRWIEGDAAAIPAGSADLVVLTGHVAQVFPTDTTWRATLRDIRRSLRFRGHFAFETMDPRARSWLGWTREASTGSFVTAAGRPFTSWVEVGDVQDDLVTFDAHVVYGDNDEHLVATDRLRFPTLDAVRASLDAAGFEALEVHGDWAGGPVTDTTGELIVLARRREP